MLQAFDHAKHLEALHEDMEMVRHDVENGSNVQEQEVVDQLNKLVCVLIANSFFILFDDLHLKMGNCILTGSRNGRLFCA